MLKFTKALYKLFVIEGLSLSRSLMIMKAKPESDNVSRAASAIYESLENGSLFSNALRSCRVVIFDDVYISFISIAEKNGDLKSALAYLKQKLEREAECRKKLAVISVYPVLVILISITASVFIGLYTKTSDLKLLIKYVLYLVGVCTSLFILFFRILGTNTLFEAFTAVDFLLRNGIELSEAVGCAVQILGPSSKAGRLFENARIRISCGMDLQSAFGCKANFEEACEETYKEWGSGPLLSKLKEAFYYADAGGSKDDLFKQLASYLLEKNERNREICLSLVEPVFIIVTGVFIFILLMTFFMPVITDTGWL